MKTLALSVCGLNLGYLGCYGNDWIATPNLDRLAAEGIVFDRHFVDVPRIDAPSMKDWLADRPRVLRELEMTGHAAWHGPSLAAPWRLPEDMLSVYTEDDEVDPWPDPPPGPLDDEEDIRCVQDTYAAAVTWFDAQIGDLLDEIDRRGWADELLLAFTATSGYPLGEHGLLGWESPWLHEELVHVPLLVRCPGKRLAGVRVAALTQPDDVAATLARSSPERDLLPLAEGAIDSLRPHAVSRWQVNGRAEASLRTMEWALLLPDGQDDRRRQLYAKPDDRWEVNDLAGKEIDIADELEKELRAVDSNIPSTNQPDAVLTGRQARP